MNWLWDIGRRIYEVAGHAVRKLTNLVERSMGESETAVVAATTALTEGVSLETWQTAMRQEIKDEYIRQYLLGRGGLSQMTQADWGSIGGMLREQYRYLDRFAGEIAEGQLTEGQNKRRSQMYVNSAREAYWRAAGQAHGWPKLPAYPGDGSTQCLTNCRCVWDVRETKDAWLCYWRLTPAEHCEDCVARAEMWNPLRIEK